MRTLSPARPRTRALAGAVAGAVAVAALAAPAALGAQQDTTVAPSLVPGTSTGQGSAGRSFTLMPHVGVMRYSIYSGLKNGPAIGLDARYDVAPRLAIGTSVSLARANTRGSDFVTALRYGDPSKGDTTFLFRLEQPVTMLDASLNATLRVPSFTARLEPYVVGGAGLYTFFLDPQANAGTSRDFSRMSALLGGGLRVQLTQAAGVTLDIRDFVLTNFDRSRLSAADSRFRINVYPEEFAPPPPARDLIHNVMFSVGFTWTPARQAGGDQ